MTQKGLGLLLSKYLICQWALDLSHVSQLTDGSDKFREIFPWKFPISCPQNSRFVESRNSDGVFPFQDFPKILDIATHPLKMDGPDRLSRFRDFCCFGSLVFRIRDLSNPDVSMDSLLWGLSLMVWISTTCSQQMDDPDPTSLFRDF
jgi:hypothetical protein